MNNLMKATAVLFFVGILTIASAFIQDTPETTMVCPVIPPCPNVTCPSYNLTCPETIRCPPYNLTCPAPIVNITGINIPQCPSCNLTCPDVMIYTNTSG